MKTIFTGLGGTVAPVVADYFTAHKHTIKRYDRDVVGTEDYGRIKTFLETESPDMFLHFALGDAEWAEMLAQACKTMNIKFIYISTVSVYGDHQVGPFTPNVIPEPSSDYGKYKLECEVRVKKANPDTTIIRIGWQIGTRPGSNNMIDYLDKQMKQYGVVKASTQFYPSASFLDVTAKAIYDIAGLSPDLYHVNSNLDKSFYDIVNILKSDHPFIKVKKTDKPQLDHRMEDSRLTIERI